MQVRSLAYVDALNVRVKALYFDQPQQVFPLSQRLPIGQICKEFYTKLTDEHQIQFGRIRAVTMACTGKKTHACFGMTEICSCQSFHREYPIAKSYTQALESYRKDLSYTLDDSRKELACCLYMVVGPDIFHQIMTFNLSSKLGNRVVTMRTQPRQVQVTNCDMTVMSMQKSYALISDSAADDRAAKLTYSTDGGVIRILQIQGNTQWHEIGPGQSVDPQRAIYFCIQTQSRSSYLEGVPDKPPRAIFLANGRIGHTNTGFSLKITLQDVTEGSAHQISRWLRPLAPGYRVYRTDPETYGTEGYPCLFPSLYFFSVWYSQKGRCFRPFLIQKPGTVHKCSILCLDQPERVHDVDRLACDISPFGCFGLGGQAWKPQGKSPEPLGLKTYPVAAIIMPPTPYSTIQGGEDMDVDANSQ